MELVGLIGSSIVTVDDMRRASEEGSRVEVEGIRTWAEERRTQAAVDMRCMQAAVDKRHRVVDKLRVVVGKRHRVVACRSQGVAEGRHSPLEAGHGHAAAACRKQ